MSTSTDKSHVEQPASFPKKDDKSAVDDIMDSGKDEAGRQASSGKKEGEIKFTLVA